MCAPSPPPAPDYAAAATAQGAANKDAAIASAKLNNPNVINPYGTQSVSYNTGSTFNQAGFDQAMAKYQSDLAKYNSASSGNGGADAFSNLLGYNGTKGAAPTAPTRDAFTTNADGLTPTITQTFSPEQQALFDKSNQTKGLLGDLGIQGATALQGVIGKQLDLSGAPAMPGSYDQTRQSVIDAMMSRADEDYGKQTDQTNSDLIAAGIRPGTKAYADRMQMIERSRNDARSQAEIQGGNAASQAFTMDSQRRQQGISEILAQRQTPLNEINALMSGSQVQNPFSMPGFSGTANMAPAPVFGAAQAQNAYDMNVYNQKAASANNMMSGLFQLGGSAAMAMGMSDRRLKSNIVRVGTHPLLGIGIYEYDIFDRREFGVMAQEVLEVKPEAVATHPSGYMMVNYGAL